MDIKDIEKNYERMSDNEIIRIATTNAYGLRPEVFGIIENEINKRNLNPDILKGAIAQNKDYSVEEIETYSKLLRDLPCPICEKYEEKLNGTISHTVKSFIFFTSSETELTIACPDCLDKKNNNAILSTALLGWWGIPWGLFKTPVYIYRNFKAKEKNRLENPNESLLSYTLGNIGEIESYKDNKEKLKDIITTKR
ncbi:hypothetical protein FA048_11525 [Pedobacter polaris]|uniref:Uncharacterized protein n=1 Tax=Pedobacter polaris TaxID=2571273 RepID=A0A4U1CSQ5_9SPHI|nr:hypothetical protein [Pedobacter polaris]TKC10793.1 hypothetical protein FA048_11525 [Pedobacter polaris]